VKKTRLSFLSLAFVLAATSAGACGRAHLSSNYGQAYSAWFVAQRGKKTSNPEDARKIVESLDAQEAAMVSRSYRKTRGGDDTGQSRMLMIGASRQGPESYMPAIPSVPQ